MMTTTTTAAIAGDDVVISIGGFMYAYPTAGDQSCIIRILELRRGGIGE